MGVLVFYTIVDLAITSLGHVKNTDDDDDDDDEQTFSHNATQQCSYHVGSVMTSRPSNE